MYGFDMNDDFYERYQEKYDDDDNNEKGESEERDGGGGGQSELNRHKSLGIIAQHGDMAHNT